jgi:ketosteroid isomerase-like protein
MHTAARNPFTLILHRRLYALVILLALTACAPALFALLQHAGVPQHPGLPRGEKHEGRRDIDQMEEAWRKAVLTGDVSVMDGLLADDYIGITPNGMLQTKEEALTWLRNQRRHITDLELSDTKVRFYGATALVTSFAHVTGVNAEGDAIGDFRYTRVYVRNAQGQWKIVSFEASRIRLPGARR